MVIPWLFWTLIRVRLQQITSCSAGYQPPTCRFSGSPLGHSHLMALWPRHKEIRDARRAEIRDVHALFSNAVLGHAVRFMIGWPVSSKFSAW
eukprot:s689_g49.t1